MIYSWSFQKIEVKGEQNRAWWAYLIIIHSRPGLVTDQQMVGSLTFIQTACHRYGRTFQSWNGVDIMKIADDATQT